MQRIFASIAILILAGVALAGGQGRGKPGQGPGKPCADEAGLCCMSAFLAETPAQPLTHAERENLLFMREEEKMARDVYLAMEARWNLRIFANIAEAEQRHADMTAMLLARHGLEDPAANRPAGEFANEAIQALYDQFIADGETSLTDALQVGARIEDRDIYDLQTMIAQTEKPDLRTLCQNLMKASRNHLRAFYRQLERQDETFDGVMLTAAQITAIVTAPHERGFYNADGHIERLCAAKCAKPCGGRGPGGSR